MTSAATECIQTSQAPRGTLSVHLHFQGLPDLQAQQQSAMQTQSDQPHTGCICFLLLATVPQLLHAAGSSTGSATTQALATTERRGLNATHAAEIGITVHLPVRVLFLNRTNRNTALLHQPRSRPVQRTHHNITNLTPLSQTINTVDSTERKLVLDAFQQMVTYIHSTSHFVICVDATEHNAKHNKLTMSYQRLTPNSTLQQLLHTYCPNVKAAGIAASAGAG